MKMIALEGFFEVTLRNLYSGEKLLVDQLGNLANAASSTKLKTALQQHQKETSKQIKRLEAVFELIEIEPGTSALEAVEGVIEKGKEAMQSLMKFSFLKGSSTIKAMIEQGSHMLELFKDSDILDYIIASGAMLIEQIEILTYNLAISVAERFGYKEAIKLLEDSLKEEKKAFETLAKIANEESNAFKLAHHG